MIPVLLMQQALVGGEEIPVGPVYENDYLGETDRGSMIVLHRGAEMTPLFTFIISKSSSVCYGTRSIKNYLNTSITDRDY